MRTSLRIRWTRNRRSSMSEALPSKRCFKCGETKPLSEFYKHPEMADGHLNKCKECNKKDVRENTDKRRDYYNAYDRVRSQSEHRRKQQRARTAQPEVKAKNAEYKRAYEYSPHQKAACVAVSKAVKDGTLVKLPCWVCGCEKVEGHHPDYDAPLDVIWLCKKHHMEIHREHDHEQDLLLLPTAEKGSRWKDVE